MRNIAMAGALLTSVIGVLAPVSPAHAAAGAPIGKKIHGPATMYDNSGVGACGKAVHPKKTVLVAVPAAYWTTANPNDDPICNLRVRVTFNGRTITVPVEDKCPSCDPSHIDLSKKAFAKLADPDRGRISVTWKFIR